MPTLLIFSFARGEIKNQFLVLRLRRATKNRFFIFGLVEPQRG
ncbi:hypothetical protein APA_759 [Pseudanabaena sp. lw0831]|nr:hypothetical protein APA_759 [Pseudanabaena sp. lw0831]